MAEMTYRERYESWLLDPDIDAATKEELKAIEGNDAEIEDRFYKELEFGTAGLRGIIGAGTNRMNRYTVAKATQGLADYINEFYEQVRQHHAPKDEEACEEAGHDCSRCAGCEEGEVPSVAIAGDSRHMSAEFEDIAAAVLNANGIRAYVFDDLRPTPELSFAVRYLGCIAGINITASHNPAEYNGYKVYWADGAQVTPPHDENIMAKVDQVKNLSNPKMMDKKEAKEKELYITIGREVDEAYLERIAACVKEPSLTKQMAKDVKIAYTPLHGAGIKIIPEILQRFGFQDLYIVKEQERPDGDFPTVQFPNPEMPEAFALADALGWEKGADIIIATDPDSDRIGLHVRDKEGAYHELNGNQIGCLICEYEIGRLKAQNKIPKDAFVVRSIVSSKLFDRIAGEAGVEVKEVLTGFKNIGAEMFKSEMTGEGTFLLAYEESYGYLVGTHARDKDACVTALVLAEMCAFYKYEDLTIWDVLLELYQKYGYTMEKTISITKKGIDGLSAIAATMKEMRADPPKELAGMPVTRFLDYEKPEETSLPKSNVLYFELEGAWVCVRPSGTEPKIKYYIGVSAPTEDAAKERVAQLEAAFVE